MKVENTQSKALCTFEIKTALGKKEVMPMIESSKHMGHQVGVNRLRAGAVL